MPFICPVCRAPLTHEGSALRCRSAHSFDLSGEGYANLLCANQKNSKLPGDDKAMVAARAAFLSKEYYRPLLDTLCRLSLAYTSAHADLLDAGCGEGYYSCGILRALHDAGREARLTGIDISKFAVRRAAKRCPQGEFAVASSYRLPLADNSFDLLLNCFSPLALDEFSRVLRRGAHFLYVVPAADHLWEMKQVLYDVPYPNEEKLTPYPGFSYVTVERTDFTLTLPSQQDIHALFGMTPYAWKTPRSGCERLAALPSLTTRASFDVHVFKKD